MSIYIYSIVIIAVFVLLLVAAILFGRKNKSAISKGLVIGFMISGAYIVGQNITSSVFAFVSSKMIDNTDFVSKLSEGQTYFALLIALIISVLIAKNNFKFKSMKDIKLVSLSVVLTSMLTIVLYGSVSYILTINLYVDQINAYGGDPIGVSDLLSTSADSIYAQYGLASTTSDFVQQLFADLSSMATFLLIGALIFALNNVIKKSEVVLATYFAGIVLVAMFVLSIFVTVSEPYLIDLICFVFILITLIFTCISILKNPEKSLDDNLQEFDKLQELSEIEGIEVIEEELSEIEGIEVIEEELSEIEEVEIIEEEIDEEIDEETEKE